MVRAINNCSSIEVMGVIMVNGAKFKVDGKIAPTDVDFKKHNKK